MQVMIVIAAVIAVAVLVAALFMLLRRPASDAPERGGAEPHRADTRTTDEPAPMSDLESALAKVTDRDGHPIRERIDAESALVDGLRVPDDTGPLLRRALDHVANPAAIADAAAAESEESEESEESDDIAETPPDGAGDTPPS